MEFIGFVQQNRFLYDYYDFMNFRSSKIVISVVMIVSIAK